MGLREKVLFAGTAGFLGIAAIACSRDKAEIIPTAAQITNSTPTSVRIFTSEPCDIPRRESDVSYKPDISALNDLYTLADYNQSPGYLSNRENELFDLINSERAKKGLCSLNYNPILNEVAEIRASQIVNAWSHRNSEGKCAFDYLDLGKEYDWAGENLARDNYPEQESVDITITDLMNSKGHRQIILEAHYAFMGVGEVRINGWSYFAIIFSD